MVGAKAVASAAVAAAAAAAASALREGGDWKRRALLVDLRAPRFARFHQPCRSRSRGAALGAAPSSPPAPVALRAQGHGEGHGECDGDGEEESDGDGDGRGEGEWGVSEPVRRLCDGAESARGKLMLLSLLLPLPQAGKGGSNIEWVVGGRRRWAGERVARRRWWWRACLRGSWLRCAAPWSAIRRCACGAPPAPADLSAAAAQGQAQGEGQAQGQAQGEARGEGQAQGQAQGSGRGR